MAAPLSISRVSPRPLPARLHRVQMLVDARGRYLTLPHTRSDGATSAALVTTCNPVVGAWLAAECGAAVLEEPLTVARHLAGVLRVDLVTVAAMSCDRDTGELEWDIFRYRPPPTSVRAARLGLIVGGPFE